MRNGTPIYLSLLAGTVERDLSANHSLTPREQQIMKSLSEGKILKEIAVEIGVREQTIKNKLGWMRKKGHFRTTIQMVAEYQRTNCKPTDSTVSTI
jgi:DNA-binding CsgD family transcriptional regulator